MKAFKSSRFQFSLIENLFCPKIISLFLFFNVIIYHIQVTDYFTRISHYFIIQSFHNTKMELEFTKRLTLCIACCCIMYWT
jgi:hypothetical protein